MDSRVVIMGYRYRALFQSVDIQFFRREHAQSFEIICEAEIKLPLLKKSFITSTEFLNDYSMWTKHSPIFEKSAENKTIQREEIQSKDILDPVGFFMLLNEAEWTDDKVHLLIGAKTVALDVLSTSTVIEVRRPEKNQKIILKKNEQGIQKIEIPVPVIGNVVVERVY